LNAGLRLLADERLAGVKIDVLASRLGVTKGSFYWHFESLSAFLEALVEHWCARRDAEVEAFPSSSTAEPAARLMYLMERISDPAAWNLERAIRAWAYSNPRLQSHVGTLDEWAFGQVRNCFQQLGFAGIDADIRAKTLYYAGIGFVHTGSLGPPERAEHRSGLLELLTQR
jgi:AcrR family transcriptional regulator